MSSTGPAKPAPTNEDPAAIEAEIARTRAQLQDTVDELSDRLNPKNMAAELTDDIKLAVTDLKRRVTGEVRPPDEPEPGKAAWVVLGTGAAVVLAVVGKIVRKL
ncbi:MULTISPECIES: DUF3618 domain-containing protein [unclassified Actinotalea]|uniref:DUF3618 domain-containing protein n=1 Tax=unclassified Actinotalea TaxID=2638618 RepID=UPI0015F73768|nr:MULTISPECIES: DUF3618 domain-containing protein [unclassified Actinotalea]